MSALQAIDARVKLLCLAAYIVAALHAHTPAALGVCLVAALALAFAVKLGGREARGVLRPLIPILVITAIMQVLSMQQGQVLAYVGPVAITLDALAATARMVVSLFAIMLASVSFMRCTATEELVRTLRWLLGPLRAAGVRTEAFMLSLSVAFRFVPVLAGEFQQVKRAQEARCASFAGSVRERLAAYTRLFAPLVRSSFRRADTLAEAFVARNFGCGTKPTAAHANRFGGAEAACIAVTAALLAASFLI